MAAGRSVVDLMRLLFSIMIFATQFVIPAQATAETGVHHSDSTSGHHLPQVQRSSFPKDFVFGTASSAYQVDSHFHFVFI